MIMVEFDVFVGIGVVFVIIVGAVIGSGVGVGMI